MLRDEGLLVLNHGHALSEEHTVTLFQHAQFFNVVLNFCL